MQGQRPPGVWLLEPMPWNHRRLAGIALLGWIGIELPLGGRYELRGLWGLPVLLVASARASLWVTEVAPAVAGAHPDWLRIVWPFGHREIPSVLYHSRDVPLVAAIEHEPPEPPPPPKPWWEETDE